MKKIFTCTLFIIPILSSFAQSDVAIGTNYQFNLQHQGSSQSAFMLHNAKVDASENYLWHAAHSSFGSRGIVMRYYDGITFYADAVATIAGQTFTPTARMFIGNNGNVGIGTSTPGSSYKLDVNGTINAAGILINGAPFAGGGSQWTTSESNIYYNTSGYVGIGTSSPSGKLNVYNSGGPTRVVIGNPNTGNGGFTSLIIGTSADANGYSSIYSIKSSGSLYGDIILNEFDGNVGIGTASPDAKLAVKGQVHAQEVKVDLNGAVAPDYVFEKDYKLTSLEEIKNYIDQNKHLPEVPSAKEMEKNGVQLGEMNMLLLRKIEELTLHLIEQNKTIAELKERSVSPDPSGKKIEELTLYVIELKKENETAKSRLKNMEAKFDKLKK
jgi:hypothetical protein